MTTSQPTHLEPSQLGTKDLYNASPHLPHHYIHQTTSTATDPHSPHSWDELYTIELLNFSHDPSDIGTVWFSDSDAEDKILQYLTSDALALPLEKTSFLDLGTGNGNMLFLLRDQARFHGRMVGVDYSAQSVMLARNIAARKGLRAEVVFERWDVMRQEPGQWARGRNGGEEEEGFGVVLDKGTFDAISMSEEVDGGGRRVCEGYKRRVEGLVRRGGYLLVTSCNWTEAELRGWFEGGELEFYGRIRYPSFAFGGETGQSISSVCFRRKES